VVGVVAALLGYGEPQGVGRLLAALDTLSDVLFFELPASR